VRRGAGGGVRGPGLSSGTSSIVCFFSLCFLSPTSLSSSGTAPRRGKTLKYLPLEALEAAAALKSASTSLTGEAEAALRTPVLVLCTSSASSAVSLAARREEAPAAERGAKELRARLELLSVSASSSVSGSFQNRGVWETPSSFAWSSASSHAVSFRWWPFATSSLRRPCRQLYPDSAELSSHHLQQTLQKA
jgi:hypothetical protein